MSKLSGRDRDCLCNILACNKQKIARESLGVLQARVTPIPVIRDFFRLLLFVAYLSDFVPSAAILLGVCFYIRHSRIISASAFSCALYEASPNSTTTTCCRLVGFLMCSMIVRRAMGAASSSG